MKLNYFCINILQNPELLITPINSLSMSYKRPSLVYGGHSKKLKSVKVHWALGLLESIKDPANIVQEDDLVVTIKDKYPKAQFHYLVVPRENLSSLKAITSKHKGLLKHMEEVGEKLAKDDRHEGRTFRLGYHSEASMFHVHLHVISDDMNSEYLKTKKHWNSFNSSFFLSSKDVRDQVDKDGRINLPTSEICKQLLTTPLKCHKCDHEPRHMPDLKKHLISHIK